MKKIIPALAMLIVAQGCSTFTRPLDQPVIEEKLNKHLFASASVGTLSLTPERRVVLVNFRNNRFCAEAPSETGIDVSKVIKATLEAKKEGVGNATAEAIAASTNNNYVLNKRSQGVQLFLANSYFTCQMYMNGGIDEGQLIQMQLETLKVVAPLINFELPLMYGDKSINQPIAPKNIVEESVDKIKKRILDNTSKIPSESPSIEPSE